MIDIPGKSWLQRVIANHFGRHAKCLFVLSTGRVGTTTLAEILQLSNRVQAEHEPYPQFLCETFDAWMAIPNRSPEFADSFLKARVRALARNRLKRFVYAECSNRLTYVAYDLLDALPNAKFIHLHRDPSEVVRSAMRRGYYQDIPSEHTDWGRNRIRPHEGDPARQQWESWTPFQKCCWYWKAINEFSSRFVQEAGVRARSLKSAELFSNPHLVSKEVCDWLEIPAPSVDAVNSLVATPSNAMVSGTFEPWENWTQTQRDQLIQIAGESASRLEYDRYRVGKSNRTSSSYAE